MRFSFKNWFLFLLIILISSFSCSRKELIYKFNPKNPKIALVISGPVSDSSWNAEAYAGLKRFKADYGRTEIAVVEKVNLSDLKPVIHELVKGQFDLIFANGYEFSKVIQKIAYKYPQTFFCVIGGEISKPPNFCSLNFRDEQYGYLVGTISGLNTTTNMVGIVVGGKIPAVERTIIGIRKGLRAVNPKADLVVSYIKSWSDVAKGKEAAQTQINTGVDVITHLADIAGIGVIKAAEEADISVIGAIKDQHDIAPGTIITSAIQDVSQLVYIGCENYIDQSLRPKSYRYGLKHQVIDLSPSYGNIEPTTENRINRIKDQLTDIEVTQDELLEEHWKKTKLAK